MAWTEEKPNLGWVSYGWRLRELAAELGWTPGRLAEESRAVHDCELHELDSVEAGQLGYHLSKLLEGAFEKGSRLARRAAGEPQGGDGRGAA